MHLRVDDQTLARGLNGGRLRRRLLRGCERQTGAERAIKKPRRDSICASSLFFVMLDVTS
jgi:hypothetical protein